MQPNSANVYVGIDTHATRPQRQPVTSEECTRYALRLLAKRYQELDEQVRDLAAQQQPSGSAPTPGSKPKGSQSAVS